MAICPNCGTKNTAKAKFCAQCGYVLGATPPGGALPAPAGAPAAALPAPAAPLQVQSLLRGRYRIASQLGKGGMGAVYLAHDANAFNRRCVVKEMLPYYTTAAEKAKAEKDFEREARVLATLRTDGVPQVYEYFIEQGNYYLVMEYIEGDNLEALAAKRGGRLPLDEALTYGLQLANILVSLGKQTPPVIHRDIKPANVIFDADQNRVKLVDFGLAKESVGGLTGTLSAPLGTPGYAPMEQYSNQVEPRTDVYALGATLHHLISGRDPRIEGGFDFPPLAQFLPGVRPEIADALARMTAPKVADRPSAAEVRDTFAAFVLPQGGRAAAQARPFTFRSGPSAFDAGDLALLCDQHWQDGIYYLYSGQFEPWLDAINRHDLAVRAESIRVRAHTPDDQSAGLEEFLRAANPTIPLPSLAVSARTLDLGTVERGARAGAALTIKNAGRGCLNGRVAAQAGWAAVRPETFSLMPNEEVQVEVSVATGALAEGPFDAPAFEVTSNGGREVVAVQAAVTWQPALVLEPRKRLELGEMLHTALEPRTAAITIRNAGGGVLAGRLATDAPWLTFDAPDFSLPSGASVTVNATATLDDPTPQSYSASVRVESNAGAQELAAAVGVRRDWYDRRTRVKTWAIYGGLVGFAAPALAAGAVLVLLLPALLPEGSGMAGWGVLGAAALCAAGGAAAYFSGRWTAQLDEMENYYHGGDLVGALLVPRFHVARPIILGGVALVYSVLAYLRALEARAMSPGLLLLGIAVPTMAGVMLGMAPGPAGARVLFSVKGRAVTTRHLFVAARTVLLMWGGALLGLALADERRWLLYAAWGALAGLLPATDVFTFLALRLSWLLDAARTGLLVGLGAFFAADAVINVWWIFAAQWRVVESYGAPALTFNGVGALLRLLLFATAGVLGGLGGLWAAGWAGKPPAQARRLLLGMAALLVALSFPVTLFCGLILHRLLPAAAGPLTFALTAAAVGAGTWALLARRGQVEAGLTRGRGLLSAGLSRSRARAASAAGALQQQIVPAGAARPGRLGARARGALGRVHLPAGWGARLHGLSLPSLAEIEAETTWPLAAGAAVLALLVQGMISALLVQAVVGLGMVALALALIVALLLGARYAYAYLRKRFP